MIKSSLKSFYNRFTSLKQFQRLAAICVVVIVAGIGTYLLSSSHAASPYGSSDADTGTLTGVANSQTCSGADDGNCVQFGTASTTIGAGQNYQICSKTSQYLTSPYTYDSLASGSQNYTIAQYEALPGYGTTLPSLPSDITSEPAGTEAAVIYAPNSIGVSLAGYQMPGTPVLFFFEGGSYGYIGMPSVSGDLFIGGSAPGYPEPEFNDGGSAAGISDSTSHFGFSGGTDTGTGSQGSTIVTVSGGGEVANSYLTFTDGTNYKVTAVSGTTLTVSPALTARESSATFWYNTNDSGNGGENQIAEVSSTAAQGSTQLSIGGWSGNEIAQPFVPGENIIIGDTSVVSSYLVDAVSGSQSSGYTLTLDTPLVGSATSGTPIWYADLAGGVTVDYLNIANDVHGTTGTLTAGSYWTIENNDIHDGYAGGANYATSSATGVAIDGADHSTIEYNCFQRMGEYALNGGGTSTAFDYNQVDQTPYQPDLSGNGQSGCGKWWGSTNNDVIDNAFTDEHYSVCIWFDNGNSGMQVAGNYFSDIDGRAIQNETGYNSDFTDNLFEDDTAGIYLNASGGWNIPGSRYNNEILINNNTFDNVLSAVSIWGASGRSCLNSGESISNGESSAYCSGGFPQVPNQPYFTHNQDSVTGTYVTVAKSETCSSGSPCSTITLSSAIAQDDWIGFTGQAPDNCTASGCGGYTNNPAATTTSDTTNVSSFTSGSPGTVHVASTTGFPSSGQVLISTSNGSPYGSTGAVLSYTNDTSTTLTGVELVSGSGTLSSGGPVIAVQPYHITAVNCPGGNCTGNTLATVSPAITSNLTAGTAVNSTGTCQYYDTVTATASSPTAPNGTAYIDGCMWEDRNISVSDNTFTINQAAFDATPLPTGESGNWSCNTGSGGNCGQNAMGYQYPGGNAEPYDNVSFSNAMMSNSTLPAPLSNLNAALSPLAVGSNGDVGTNNETAYNDLWSGNTYNGTWTFQAYVQAADCPVSWSGTALEWVNGGGNACAGLSLAQWQSYWHQN
jgi:hypothetical protein